MSAVISISHPSTSYFFFLIAANCASFVVTNSFLPHLLGTMHVPHERRRGWRKSIESVDIFSVPHTVHTPYIPTHVLIQNIFLSSSAHTNTPRIGLSFQAGIARAAVTGAVIAGYKSLSIKGRFAGIFLLEEHFSDSFNALICHAKKN